MSAMKRIDEILEGMFRPLCKTCHKTPKNKPEGFCFYCEAHICQCDVSDICDC
jgi:hypothetical protein